MKAQFLKIAKCKTDKQFYDKYPSEAAFFKAHPEAKKLIKKAQNGVDINGNGIPDYLENTQAQMGPRQGFLPQPISSMYSPNIQQTGQNAFQPTDSFAMPNYGQQFINKANQTTSGMRGIPQALPNDVGYTPPKADATGEISSYIGAATDIIGGIKGLSGQKKEKDKARQARKVTDIQALASGTREEEKERRYNTPWDNPVQANQMFPTYGVGTNVITRNGGSIQRAEYGTQMSGNPTEIQNTYDPYDIYSDGGYEPLNDSDVKQYYHGGRIHQMQDGGGFSDFMIKQGGGQALGNITNMFSNNSAESQIGKGVGTGLGTAFGGPVGGMIGGAIGNIAGGMLNTSQKSIKRDQNAINRNIGTMIGNATGQGLQAQYSSYVKNGGDIPSYEEGGYMNPEYNPQVIAMFGDHTAEDFADYAHKDEFRAGGHLKAYTPPSNRAMEIYEDGGDIKSYGLGGELQTHWGGGAETISRNPYLPGTGETVMFRGKSHEEYSPNGETGIGVTYAGNPVEVERGEPMVELEEGGVVDPMTGEVQKSGVVFGNLKIPNQYIDLLGDPNAKDKKFKTYVGVDLYKQEQKGNKLVEQGTSIVNKKDATPLEIKTGEAIIFGGNSILMTAADRKINAAALQDSINKTAEEYGLVADDLARGKVKIDKEAMKQSAKFGGKFTKAQDGYISKYGITPWQGNISPGNKYGKATASSFSAKQWDDIADKLGFKGKGNKEFQEFLLQNKESAPLIKARHKMLYNQDPMLDEKIGFGWAANELLLPKAAEIPANTTPADAAKEIEDTEEGVVPKKNNWMNMINAVLPYFRPTDQEGLDPNQLSGEMYALSSNQLEPVPTQGFQPDLGVPYDISLQDQLNANQSDYRAAQRMMGYNPAAQANLNAQKYQANQGILGEQFRANQAMKDKVYAENRNILNQAKLTNLGIYDKQYERQAQALSNTKATTQAALSSIADKYAKNKLENRQLGIMENMYNYRYDDQGRAINMNPLAQFNMEGRGTSSKQSAPEGYEYETVLKKTKEKDVARNGSIVKSYKNI